MMRQITCLLAAGVVLIPLAGCVFGVDRLNNQGGGNLITAAGKATGGNLSSLTPDEVQVATDFAIDQFGLAIPSLTDDQAAAVVQFLEDNALNSVEDIQGLEQNPREIVVSPEVQAAVESLLRGLGTDFSFDGPVASQGD